MQFPTGSRQLQGLLWALLAAAVLRLLWIALVPNVQFSDSQFYDAAAARLAALGEYGEKGPSAWHPPGYPFILALLYWFVGHSQEAGKLLNVAISLALVATTYAAARQVTLVRNASVAATLVACWPNLVFHTSILSSDLFAALGFTTAVWLAGMRANSRRATAAQLIALGVTVGWTMLTRPVGVILIPAVGLVWWVRQHSLRNAVLYLLPVVAICLAIVGTWTLRNYARFGQVIPITTNGGYNFFTANNPYADGDTTFWDKVPKDDPTYDTVYDRIAHGDELTRNRMGFDEGLRFLRAEPLHPIRQLPAKIRLLFGTDTSGLWEGALDAESQVHGPVADFIVSNAAPWKAVSILYYAAVMALALGSIRLAPSARRDLLPILLLPLLLIAFHILFPAKDRYHIPIAPLLAIPAALSVEALRLAQVPKLWRRRTVSATVSG